MGRFHLKELHLCMWCAQWCLSNESKPAIPLLTKEKEEKTSKHFYVEDLDVCTMVFE